MANDSLQSASWTRAFIPSSQLPRVLLSLSFVSSVTAQEFRGSCIFLFVKHPYDISGRVDIYGPNRVHRLEWNNLTPLYELQTNYRPRTHPSKSPPLLPICPISPDLNKTPNNILDTLWINNITRSQDLPERLELCISFDISMSDIETLLR
jgi:hypothetical protein